MEYVEVYEVSDGGFTVAPNETTQTAMEKSSELGYQGLKMPIEISSSGAPELGTAKNASKPERPSYKKDRNDTDSEPKDEGEDQSSTLTFPSIISSQFESNGSAEILVAPPHLPLHLQNGDDLVSKRHIEESDAELMNEAASPDNEEVDNDTRAAIARAPMTGRGLPAIRREPDVPFEPSEVTDITDLGIFMYDLKTQGRKSTSSYAISQGDPKEPLQNRLLAALQETPGHAEKKGFFPLDLIASFVHEECVIEELRGNFKHLLDDNTIRNYAQKICGIAPAVNDGERLALFKKIFVTLVLCEKTSAIPKFLAEGVTDDDLPLVKVPLPGKSLAIFDLGRSGNPKVALECFREGWSSCAIRRFEEWQWTTLAPFFGRSERKNVKHFILQDQVILPFTADGRREADVYDRLEFGGGFSQVFKVDIHPDHHDFHDPHACNRSFAIKCLLSRDRADFKREVEMLKKFSGDSHPHLVSLLATYEQFRRFYLVFHWAEADLLDYWKEINPTPSVDGETILWMAKQCEGIADGLSKIHRYESSNSKLHPDSARQVEGLPGQSLTLKESHSPANAIFGRHGDIKPANVLWFREADNINNRGTLKITDFGLAEFSTFHSRSYKPKSKVATSPNYRPPECDLQDGVIGRSYDIWTLGCLYLEFVTWVLGGWDLVQEFLRKRTSFDRLWYDMHTDTFFEIVKCGDTGTVGAMIKPAVTDFIEELHSHESCTEYLHDFLNLIEMDMMIVKPNDPKDRGRISCGELHHKLLAMVRHCERDADYASKPAPWSRSEMERRPVGAAVEADLAQPAAEALGRKDLRVHNGPTQRRFMLASRTVPVGCES